MRTQLRFPLALYVAKFVLLTCLAVLLLSEHASPGRTTNAPPSGSVSTRGLKAWQQRQTAASASFTNSQWPAARLRLQSILAAHTIRVGLLLSEPHLPVVVKGYQFRRIAADYLFRRLERGPRGGASIDRARI